MLIVAAGATLSPLNSLTCLKVWLRAVAAIGLSRPHSQAATNVRFWASKSYSWSSALSSKAGLGQLQLSAIDRFGAVNGCIAAKPSPRH